MTDPAERIVNLMADGRERTTNDIAVKLKLQPDVVQFCLLSLARRHRIATARMPFGVSSISIWRAVQ
jgi:DNA-binding CsgD family transcriptional regulator